MFFFFFYFLLFFSSVSFVSFVSFSFFFLLFLFPFVLQFFMNKCRSSSFLVVLSRGCELALPSSLSSWGWLFLLRVGSPTREAFATTTTPHNNHTTTTPPPHHHQTTPHHTHHCLVILAPYFDFWVIWADPPLTWLMGF